MTHGKHTKITIHAKVLLRTSVDCARAEIAMLFKFFKKQSLPTSNVTDLPDAVTNKINSAMKKVLEEEGNRAGGRK